METSQAGDFGRQLVCHGSLPNNVDIAMQEAGKSSGEPTEAERLRLRQRLLSLILKNESRRQTSLQKPSQAKD
jgi:hypothetical protein